VLSIIQHTLRAFLLDAKAAPVNLKTGASTSTASAQARLIKGVFALYGNCDVASRKELVEQVMVHALICGSH
jgi:hypothetical protein